jgi:hypothetical protein
MKLCRYCGETKPINEFYGDKGAADGHRPECKTCTAERRREWYAKNRRREIERVIAWQRDNPERYAERQRQYKASGKKSIADRKSHLKRTYGLTPEQYDEMLAFQGGVCAICREKPGALSLHVDHDHTTGAVRGLLCVRCNNALGLFKESHDLFAAAADYLERHDPEELALRDRVLERLLELALPN